ncbi:hypothetical protein BO99DRAFT_233342 [Aspergillus violaceofuscus CBS 115571]|uniref:Uncharacterized protein n=1 Tax=Aspergillus violaceofuscus (strain CBS 115571) TaxID=1450538 RepID=A0A2V5GX14_ASPV1|nr:hypothetical protein BO99DRAFT_233342 [Aspergillus violaceofuscus CBS 115571]
MLSVRTLFYLSTTLCMHTGSLLLHLYLALVLVAPFRPGPLGRYGWGRRKRGRLFLLQSPPLPRSTSYRICLNGLTGQLLRVPVQKYR